MKSLSGEMTHYYTYDNSFSPGFAFHDQHGYLHEAGEVPQVIQPFICMYSFILNPSLSASANPQSYLVFFLWRNSKRLHSPVCSLDGGENHCTVFLLSFEYFYVTLVSENLWLKVLESIILFKDDILHPPLQKMTKSSYLMHLFFKIHRSVQRIPVYTQQYKEIIK